MSDETKIKNSEKLYEGAIKLFLYNFDMEEIKPENKCMTQEQIKYAKVANIMFGLVFTKESIVERASDNFTSLIDEEFIDSQMNIIATKTENGYKIGNYESDGSTIIAIIRNSFAHGTFEVIDNNVRIHNNEDILDIDIDKLSLFTKKIISNLKLIKKSNTYSEVIPNYSSNKINACEIVATKETDLTYDEKLKIKYYIEWYKEVIDGLRNKGIDYKDIISTMNKKFSKPFNNIDIKFKKIKISSDHYDQFNIIKKRLENDMPEVDKNFVFCEYIKQIITNETYKTESLIAGCDYNFVMLDALTYNNSPSEYMVMSEYTKMLLKKSTNECKTMEDLLLVTLFRGEKIISSLMSTFMSLYGYPLDNVYKPGESYVEDRTNYLNFSALDLEKFAPAVNNYKTSALEQIQMKYIADNKKIEEILIKKEGLEAQIDGCSKENLCHIRENLEHLQEKYEELVNIGFKDYNEYETMFLDYLENEDYFIKRNIIEGIRNSIAHGSVKFNKFIMEDNIRNVEITFINNYKGKECFNMTIKFIDLLTLVNKNNVLYIDNFFKTKSYKR